MVNAKTVAIPDLKEGNYIALVDETLQYANTISINSSRHRVKNNLPGTVNFCPLIHKTIKIEQYMSGEQVSFKIFIFYSATHCWS